MEKGIIPRSGDKKMYLRILPWCVLVFFLSAAASLIAAAVNRIYPFGEKTVLVSDLSGQYMPFLAELYDKVHAGESIFYSWKTGAGGSFFGTVFYYLSSPFNLLVLLFPRSQIQGVMAVLILLRQALSAVTMTVFLSLRKSGKSGIEATICGFLYACCGWFAAYYYNVIWLDVFMLMPLLLLGIEMIIDRSSPKLYMPVLLVMIFSNFYSAYIACIFAIVYWLYYFFTNYTFTEMSGSGKKAVKVGFFKSRFFRTGSIFAFSSVGCVLLLSFMVVPLLLQMSGNESNEQLVPLAAGFSNIAEQISALFSGMTANSNRFDRYPNIYTGVLALVCVPLFFCSKGISVKEKLISAGVLLFLILSFNLKSLDYLWHGFRWPNCFPFRESFMFSCFVLILTHRVLTQPAGIPKKNAAVCAVTLFALLISGAIYVSGNNSEIPVLTGADIGITAALFAVLAVIIFLSKKKKAAALICSAAILALSFADAVYTVKGNVLLLPEDGYNDYIDNYEALTSLYAGINDSNVYRTETARLWLTNDGSYFGTNGLRQASSTADSAVYALFKKLGMDTNLTNYTGYFPQTPAFNSMFGIKHISERKEWDEAFVATYADRADEGYSLASENEIYRMFDYAYALPIGYAVSDKVADWQPEEHMIIDNQNGFFNLACGESDILKPSDSDVQITYQAENMNVSEKETHRYSYTAGAATGEGEPSLVYKFTAVKDGAFYIYFDKLLDTDQYIHIGLLKPDKNVESFSLVSSTLTSNVYDAKAGDEFYLNVYLNPDSTGELTVRGFQTDGEKMKGAYNKICSYGTLQPDEFRDGYFNGKIAVEGENKILCTSVPYDKGWSITVDGQALPSEEILKIGGALMGFKLTPGEHTVTFSFFPSGLKAGAAISAATLAAGAVLLIIYKKRKK